MADPPPPPPSPEEPPARSEEIALPPGASPYGMAAALARWLQAECGATIRGYDVTGGVLTIPAEVSVQRVMFLHLARQSAKVVATSRGLCRRSEELVGLITKGRREREELRRTGRALHENLASSATRLRQRMGRDR